MCLHDAGQILSTRVNQQVFLVSVVIAIAVPNLSPVLSLVGAVGFSSLGLLFPAIAETALNWNSRYFAYIMIKNTILVVIFVFAMISGSIISVQEIVEQYNLSWCRASAYVRYSDTFVYSDTEFQWTLCTSALFTCSVI